MKHYLVLLIFLTGMLRANCQSQYTIPVVFHILYQNQSGPENIADSQVYDAMRILNRDFNKQNADTAAVIAPFDSLIANVGVHFQLAGLDPNGNPTTGIDRIQTSLTDSGGFICMTNQWNPCRYLNIWTINEFAADQGPGGPVFPATADSFPSEDGIVELNNYVGSIGTSAALTSRALTHDVGTYLNLLNTWGFGPAGVRCGDDSVQDTPITKGWESCPDSANAAVCNPPIVENYQNYMDFSECSCMFTIGQKARMLNSLNSSVACRNNLYLLSNLINTGVTTAINETSLQNLIVFPNPFSNTVQLQGLSTGTYTIVVEDMLGRTVVTEKNIQLAEMGRINLDLSGIETSGIYLLKVFDGESTGTFKIAKQ